MGEREKREIQAPLGEKVAMAPRVNVELQVALVRRVLQASLDKSALLARVFLASQAVWASRVTVERLDPKGSRVFLESVAPEENLGAW